MKDSIVVDGEKKRMISSWAIPSKAAENKVTSVNCYAFSWYRELRKAHPRTDRKKLKNIARRIERALYSED